MSEIVQSLEFERSGSRKLTGGVHINRHAYDRKWRYTVRSKTVAVYQSEREGQDINTDNISSVFRSSFYRRATASERVKHEFTGVRGRFDDAFVECKWLLGWDIPRRSDATELIALISHQSGTIFPIRMVSFICLYTPFFVICIEIPIRYSPRGIVIGNISVLSIKQ